MAKKKQACWSCMKKEHLVLLVVAIAVVAAVTYEEPLDLPGDRVIYLYEDEVAAQDISLCNKYEEPEQSECKAVVSVAMQTPEICGTLPQELADKCFYEIARDTESHIICSAIEETERRDICYREIVIDTNDMWPCLSITDPDQKDYCLWEWSGFMGALDGCDRINSTYLADLCYWRHASSFWYPGACDWVKMPEVKEKCELESMTIFNDGEINMCSPSYCDACIKEECTRVVGCDPLTIYPQGDEAEYGGCGPMELEW